MGELHIEWTEYLQYRAVERGFDLVRIEEIVRYSPERYIDNATGRLVAIGKQDKVLLMVPYEIVANRIRPITVHATTRTQIDARRASGRFTNE